MSQRDPLGRESYTELMNEWAETRNAMLRMQGGILHPPAYLSPMARLFGYVWRVAVVLIVVTVAAFLFLKSHIKGSGFSDMVGAKMGVILKASEVELSSFRWKRSVGSAKYATFKGSDESFFLDELKAEGFRFKLPMKSLLKPNWELEDVFIGDLTADVRPGSGGTGLAVVEDQEGAWGINPDLSQVSFEKVDVANANLTWGIGAAARGSLKNAELELVKSDGIWQLLVHKGDLSQNYLRDLKVSSLKIRFHEGTLAFSDGEFKMGETGTGKLEGTIHTGEYPEFDLTLRVDNCDITSLLPKHTSDELALMSEIEGGRASALEVVRKMLVGRVTGVIKIGGSTNSSSGIKTTGTLRFSEDQDRTLRLVDVPFFNDLGGITGNGYLRRPLVTAGTLSFVTSEGMFSAPAINLELGQSGRLTGEFSFGITEMPKKDTTPKPPPVPGVPVLDEEPVALVPEFSGAVQFGVNPMALDNIPESVRQQFFPKMQDGLIWMNLPLEGTLNRFTAKEGRALVDAVRTAGEPGI